jgi:hypothetical protein
MFTTHIDVLEPMFKFGPREWVADYIIKLFKNIEIRMPEPKEYFKLSLILQ